MRRSGSLATRWLGVGLASALAVVTLGLAFTGKLSLYLSPSSTWFAVGMSILLLVGAIASFALPLGAEEDHGHDHADEPSARLHTEGAPSRRRDVPRHAPAASHESAARHPLTVVAAAVGGTTATAIVLLVLALPPASLSQERAMQTAGTTPLFGGTDVVTLASTGDTADFGVGDWATVFATATNPEAFDGDTVELTGFVTGSGDGFDLTRFVITHCVIDAQTATLPIEATEDIPADGQWVTVSGTVRARSDGTLEIDPTSVQVIDEPEDPYEY